MFKELEETLNNIQLEAKQAREKSATAVELLHDVKYKVIEAKRSINANSGWWLFTFLACVLACILSGSALFQTNRLREEIRGGIQAQDERPSGAGSKDTGSHR